MARVEMLMIHAHFPWLDYDHHQELMEYSPLLLLCSRHLKAKKVISYI